MADDLRKKGLELRAKLFGEKAAKDGDDFLSKFDQGFATFLNEQLFGTIARGLGSLLGGAGEFEEEFEGEYESEEFFRRIGAFLRRAAPASMP
jgi:hypothetical protein